ncbi:MAG: iron-containing alcohol dehydrogenase [Oscillospiraceae bacterium]
MNNFIFENKTKTIFGKGCVKEYLPCFLKNYGKNVMLAYGGGSIKKNGVYDEITAILCECGKTVTEFSGIMPNPTYSKVLEGAALAKDNDIDLIIAVGGGSVMDCCKAVSLAAKYDGDVWSDFWAKPGIIGFEPVPLCVVVTASGTGSEMNGGAVITNEELKIKTGRDYPKCNPVLTLLDPTYTYSVPKRQMVSGAFDTLSHIMEIYFSVPDEQNVSDDIAEALMRGVIRDLRTAVKDPEDYTARSNLMWEATMAENRIIKLGKKTDFECHMMEHQLGAYTDCNHGEGLAVLHPEYYRHIFAAGKNKFARFAVNVWGISAEGKSEIQLAKEGVEALAAFIKEVGLPTTLREIGVTESTDLKVIADSCVCVPTAYKVLNSREILDIFKACY